MNGPFRIGLATVLLTIVLMFATLWIKPVYGRDRDGRYANSELKQWFDSLRSGKGPCCSDADGNVVKDADWEAKDGHYRVRIEDAWIDVEENAVITEPNLFGRTMVWPMTYLDGTIVIRCFMPGPMI